VVGNTQLSPTMQRTAQTLGKSCEVENLTNRSVDSDACQPELQSFSGMTSARRSSYSSYWNAAGRSELKLRGS
jgi:hypothetical protein